MSAGAYTEWVPLSYLADEASPSIRDTMSLWIIFSTS